MVFYESLPLARSLVKGQVSERVKPPNKCLSRHVNERGAGSRGSQRTPSPVPSVPRRGLQAPAWGPRREGRQPRTVPRGLTHAEAAGGVQSQAAGALTAEGAGSVEAAPIGTDPREDFALIHIWAAVEKGERQGLELPRWGFRTPRLSSGRRKGDSASFGGWGISGKTPRKGTLYLDLKRLQDPRHPPRQAPARVQLAGRGEPQRGRELPSQVSPVMRAKPWAQAGSVVGRTRVGTGVTFSIQTPVLSTGTQATIVATPGRTPRATPRGAPRALPGSQRSHGLPQAAPRVAQHWDRREAPRRFASQRPSWTWSQQVPLVLSAGEAATHVTCQPTPAHRPTEARPSPGWDTGPGSRVTAAPRDLGPLT